MRRTTAVAVGLGLALLVGPGALRGQGPPDRQGQRRTELEEQVRHRFLEHVADPDAFLDLIEYLYEHPHEKSRNQIRLEDGRVFDRYSAPVEGDDTYFGRVWFYRDITERVEYESELRRIFRDRIVPEDADMNLSLMEGLTDDEWAAMRPKKSKGGG